MKRFPSWEKWLMAAIIVVCFGGFAFMDWAMPEDPSQAFVVLPIAWAVVWIGAAFVLNRRALRRA